MTYNKHCRIICERMVIFYFIILLKGHKHKHTELD